MQQKYQEVCLAYHFGIRCTNNLQVYAAYSIQGAESLHRAAVGRERVTSEEGRDIFSYPGVPALSRVTPGRRCRYWSAR